MSSYACFYKRHILKHEETSQCNLVSAGSGENNVPKFEPDFTCVFSLVNSAGPSAIPRAVPVAQPAEGPRITYPYNGHAPIVYLTAVVDPKLQEYGIVKLGLPESLHYKDQIFLG